MSTNFSGNQYEKSFSAQRLQNWQIPKQFKEHPTPRTGGTVPVSNDRGHLLQGIPRANTSPWGNFKGTWDSEMDCRKTIHCQTLATLKSEGTSCLNNQIKKTKHLKQKELTLTNKQHDKIFEDFSKMRPNRNGSPVASPVGNDKTHLDEVQQNITIADHAEPGTAQSPIEMKAPTPLKPSPIASPVASPKPQTPVTPTLEDKLATPVKPNSPGAPMQDTSRSPALVD